MSFWGSQASLELNIQAKQSADRIASTAEEWRNHADDLAREIAGLRSRISDAAAENDSLAAKLADLNRRLSERKAQNARISAKTKELDADKEKLVEFAKTVQTVQRMKVLEKA